MAIATTDKFNQLAVSQLATAGALETVTIGLYTNSVTPTHETVLANLTQPSFSTYSLTPITWNTTFQQADSSMAVQSSLCEFQLGISDTPVTLQGYFVQTVISSVPYLLFAENFAQPQALTNSLDALIVTPQFSLGEDCSNSSATVIN